MNQLWRKMGFEPITFRGHGIFPDGWWTSVGLALLSWVFLAYFLVAILVIRNKVLTLVLGYVFLCYLPSPTYLFLEIRHIFVEDGVADGDERDAAAIAVISGLSLLGLICSVANILLAAHTIPILSQNVPMAIVLLSFLSAFGAVLGLQNLPTLFGIIFPPSIIIFTFLTIRRWKLVILALGMGCLLSIINLGIEVCAQATLLLM